MPKTSSREEIQERVNLLDAQDPGQTLGHLRDQEATGRIIAHQAVQGQEMIERPVSAGHALDRARIGARICPSVRNVVMSSRSASSAVFPGFSGLR